MTPPFSCKGKAKARKSPEVQGAKPKSLPALGLLAKAMSRYPSTTVLHLAAKFSLAVEIHIPLHTAIQYFHLVAAYFLVHAMDISTRMQLFYLGRNSADC